MSAPARPISRLFSERFGSPPAAVVPLPADASSRTYFRLTGPDGRTVIGARGPEPRENRAFLSFSSSLRSAGLPVPEIYAADEDAGVWLAEDLGDTTLHGVLEAARRLTGGAFPAEAEAAFARALTGLTRLQTVGGRVVDFSAAHPRPDFDALSILWDLNYFKYHFLRLAKVPFREGPLEDDFRALAAFALAEEAAHFVHRDFQSRNIMLRDGEPWFIDYQGGRRGALQYDVASLLFSGTTGVPAAARERLLGAYLDALESEQPVDRGAWTARYRGFVLIRMMQAMGAYGYRGIFERRALFTGSIPTAAGILAELLEDPLPVPAPELELVFRRIVDRWAEPAPRTREGLEVEVSSFSYRRGYPRHGGDHGGGFVFDCRALPNPGREERYRGLTGLDAPVIRALERAPETARFWTATRGLVDAQVDNYLARGFRDLAIAYGCTGGQHRSVYFAERMARHIGARQPAVRVRIRHREAARWPRSEGTGPRGDRWTR